MAISNEWSRECRAALKRTSDEIASRWKASKNRTYVEAFKGHAEAQQLLYFVEYVADNVILRFLIDGDYEPCRGHPIYREIQELDTWLQSGGTGAIVNIARKNAFNKPVAYQWREYQQKTPVTLDAIFGLKAKIDG